MNHTTLALLSSLSLAVLAVPAFANNKDGTFYVGVGRSADVVYVDVDFAADTLVVSDGAGVIFSNKGNAATRVSVGRQQADDVSVDVDFAGDLVIVSDGKGLVFSNKGGTENAVVNVGIGLSGADPIVVDFAADGGKDGETFAFGDKNTASGTIDVGIGRIDDYCCLGSCPCPAVSGDGQAVAQDDGGNDPGTSCDRACVDEYLICLNIVCDSDCGDASCAESVLGPCFDRCADEYPN